MATPDPIPTFAELEEDALRVRVSAGFWPLASWSWIEIVGDDRKGWLQGQQTNDLRTLEPGGSLELCFCSPTGQLLADGKLWDFGDSYVLGLPTGGAETVLRRFEEMVFLEDVRAQPLGPVTAVTVQGASATARLSELVSLPSLDSGVGEMAGLSLRCLRSDRSGVGGWDLLLDGSADAALQILGERFPSVPPAAVGLLRIEAGIPLLGVDTDSKTLPPELGPAYQEAHISYTKGCYTGQEVLMRMHSRGHTNRTWMGLVCEEAVRAGDAVRSPRRPDAGKVTSTVGRVAAAMIRREAAFAGEEVEVETFAGTVRAELRAMPMFAQPGSTPV